LNAPEIVPLEHGNAHIVGNPAIVLLGLAVLFQQVDADSKIISAAIFGKDEEKTRNGILSTLSCCRPALRLGP
jgi:hypothetical protein